MILTQKRDMVAFQKRSPRCMKITTDGISMSWKLAIKPGYIILNLWKKPKTKHGYRKVETRPKSQGDAAPRSTLRIICFTPRAWCRRRQERASRGSRPTTETVLFRNWTVLQRLCSFGTEHYTDCALSELNTTETVLLRNWTIQRLYYCGTEHYRECATAELNNTTNNPHRPQAACVESNVFMVTHLAHESKLVQEYHSKGRHSNFATPSLLPGSCTVWFLFCFPISGQASQRGTNSNPLAVTGPHPKRGLWTCI